MYKLLLADDEPLVLIGLKSMLQNEKYGVEICATARNGEQALALIKSEKPDIGSERGRASWRERV